jgi:hypothetical protein
MGSYGRIKHVTQSNRTVTNISSVTVESSNGVSISQDVHSVRILYDKIYDMVCLINCLFGLPVLATTCFVLVELVMTVYFALCCFQADFIIGICNNVLLFVIFIKMAAVCQIAENEKETSGILVQKLLLADNLRENVCKELALLSTQLRDMNIKYTACGFFTLNFPCLCSLVGLIVSYVIIMFQIL